jgi:RimJ/RimL family protein N-acetyltransferase
MSLPGPLLRREGETRGGRRYSIRPTRPEDVPALIDLLDAVAAEGDLVAAEAGDRTATEEGLALAGLLSQGGLSLTLEVDGVLAGRILVWRRRGRYDSHIGELAILVGAGYRGEGMGRALISAALDWGRAVGLRKVGLGVYPDNRPAVALYRSLGFVDEGLQRRQLHVGGVDRDVALMAVLLD